MLRAKKKATEEQEKTLTDSFRDEMQYREIGEFAPPTSQFKVVLSEYDRSDVDWKDIAHELAKTAYGAKWKAALNKMKADYGKTEIASVLLKPNENYRG